MSRLYSLSYLTLEASPPEAILFAARAGYQFAGVRVLPAYPGGAAFRLMDDPQMLRETVLRTEHTGVRVLDVEIARLDATMSVAANLPLLDAAARIGAQTVIAAGDDQDERRLTDHFAELCDAAAQFGLTVNLEFTPWTTLSCARAATRLVEAAGRPNGEILIDTIHAARSATTLADLAAIKPSRMSYFQICDAPAGIPDSREELIFTARKERLLPGEGAVGIAGIVAALPPDLIVSVEIPNHARMAQLGRQAWAKRTLEASRALMRELDVSRPPGPVAAAL